MVYGPYAEMEPGVYDITFDYDMIDAGDGSIGFAEVVSGDGAQVFGLFGGRTGCSADQAAECCDPGENGSRNKGVCL